MGPKSISKEQILSISTRIEREGKDFYASFANEINDPAIKSLLQSLSKEEINHEKQFIEFLNKKGSIDCGWKKNIEVQDFIDEHFQTDIFPSLEKIQELFPSFKKIHLALEFALDAEKTSAEFYKILGEYCEDTETKAFLIFLENSEREHIKTIKELMLKFLPDQIY